MTLIPVQSGGPDPIATLDDATARRRLHLMPQHEKAILDDSAIHPDVAAERGYRSLHRGSTTTDYPEAVRTLKALGIPKAGWAEPSRLPGLILPMYRPTGERAGAMWRPDNPPRDPKTGKARKYLAPQGRPATLDVHPRNARYMPDPSVALYVTEGIKKADALTSRGLCAVALSGVYNWRSTMGTLGDWEDIFLKGRRVVIAFDSDATTNPNVVRAMKRLGAWLRSKGAHPEYLIPPHEVGGVPTKGVDDYFAAGGTVEGLRPLTSTTPPDDPATDDYFSDSRMAETVSDDLLDGQYAWAQGLGWLKWDGARWREVPDPDVAEAVRSWVLGKMQDAIAEARGKRGGSDQIDGWRSMLSASRQKAVLGMCRGIVLVDIAEFDANPDVLNTPSGLVDLVTGELSPVDPAAMCRKVTRATYVPGATHPAWDAALEAVPAEARDWLQMYLGQAITGHTSTEDQLLVCQGGGENGKTAVLTDGVARAIGDYYTLVSDRMLMGNPDQHPTETMDLMGARLALLEETQEARRLDTQKIKRTIGTPVITARRIMKDSVTFEATHTLVITTNHLPVVSESDNGTWRRLLTLRFPYRFVKPGVEITDPEGERAGDLTLKPRLKRDPEIQSAILAWLVEGARRWYANDRMMTAPPAAVEEATRAWRVKSDLILGYLSSGRVEADPGAHVMAVELLSDFNAWLDEQGHKPWNDRLLTDRFENHGEVKEWRLGKKRIRPGQASAGTLSRPTAFSGFGNVAAPPDRQYVAWLGLAFVRGE